MAEEEDRSSVVEGPFPKEFRFEKNAEGMPLILYGNSKHPILIPPSIADLLRDKPPETDLNYMEDDDFFEEKESHSSNNSDSELPSQEEEIFHGVKVHGERGHLNPSPNPNPVKIQYDFWSQFKTITPKLVPFLKTLGLYFVIFIPEDRPSWFGLLLKCLPVLSLALFVLLHGISFSQEHKFSRRILGGLLFSCLGDAFLIWPSYFLHGMAAFGVAQCFYICAFGFEPLNLRHGTLVYFIASTSLYLMTPGLLADAVPVVIGVLIYATLLTTMVWRATARVQFVEDLWSWTKLCSCLGGISFVVSDMILALNMFYTQIPYHQVLVMVTYYLAQLGIALSVVNSKEAYKSESNGSSKPQTSTETGMPLHPKDAI